MSRNKHQKDDEYFMRLAIKEAEHGIGRTAPNPSVGAVIVKNGCMLSKAHHRAAGLPHAEIEALQQLSFEQSQEATIYVTLEPCSSQGRTPPCTTAIISSGIKRVVYGAIDPDKRHCGRASMIFKQFGIHVIEGILVKECEALNMHWNHRVINGLPWVIAKAGISLDGKMDSPSHRRRWITSGASRKEAMCLRASVESILVGGGTVREDDPSLTIRDIKIAPTHPQPWRVIWTYTGNIPKHSKILTDVYRNRTIILQGMKLRTALRAIAKKGISSVLIEGGGRTLGEAFQGNLVNEVCFFVAPIIQGGMVPVLGDILTSQKHLRDIRYKKIGSDLMITAKVDQYLNPNAFRI